MQKKLSQYTITNNEHDNEGSKLEFSSILLVN